MINPADTYKIFADFYDLYTGKFEADLDFYKSNCNNTGKIIEIGCGTGRILEYLLSLGYELTGVDISQEMLDKAAVKLKKWTNNGKLRLINHDFTNSSLSDTFDTALLTFYTFNYIVDKPVNFLQNIYDILPDKGLLLADLFYPNTMYDKSIDNKWVVKEYLIEGKQVKIKDKRQMAGRTEHRSQIFCIDNQEVKIETDRRYYSPAEMKELLLTAGFSNISFSPDYDLTGFTDRLDETGLKSNYIVKAIK